MFLLDFLKSYFLQPRRNDYDLLSEEEALHININVVVVEFNENVESSSGEILAAQLHAQKHLTVRYFDEPFSKSFLNLEGRTFFDFIDKGQAILAKTKADILIWGHREDGKIRLNFQTPMQYERSNSSFLSLLDSLYLPASLFDKPQDFPLPILNIIIGAIVAALDTPDKTAGIRQKYLLKKTINILSKDSSAKNLGIEYMPYIMNFLALIYLSYCRNNDNDKEFKVVNSLLATALEHKNLIKNPLHLGCIYNHLGQLHECAINMFSRKSEKHFKGAIRNYQLAQKHLGKYVYPYDYGFISYRLSDILYDYWRQKEDIQALRDSVFNLRETEKIFTYSLFPEFWADIEGLLGHRLNILSSLTQNNAIAELAINAYKNQQKIVTEKRDPFAWAAIQEEIGNIYYRLGRDKEDKDLLEESLEYFHDALYIFENMELSDNAKRVTVSIAKASDLLE